MYFDENEGIIVELVDLPTSIKGFTKKNDDMTHTIVLNARLTKEQQYDAYEHELKHIKDDDFNSVHTADYIESEQHKGE